MRHTVTAALLLALAAPSIAVAQTGVDRRLGHRAVAGLGATWTENEGLRESTTGAGAVLGFDFALGRYVAVGVMGDLTASDSRAGGSWHLLLGPQLKLILRDRGAVRPWVSGEVAVSVADETGIGAGYGAGAAFPVLPGRVVPFLEVRNVSIADMEFTDFDQVMVRAGILF